VTGSLGDLFESSVALFEIRVDLIPMRKVERDSAVSLFQRQRRESLDNRLGGFSLQKLVHDRIKGHTTPYEKIPTVALLHVFVTHLAL